MTPSEVRRKATVSCPGLAIVAASLATPALSAVGNNPIVNVSSKATVGPRENTSKWGSTNICSGNVEQVLSAVKPKVRPNVEFDYTAWSLPHL